MIEKTPISVLQHQLEIYNKFLNQLLNREGIRQDAPQDKLDNYIQKLNNKIKEFQGAIQVLEKNNQNET